jgi:hypothetical protein
MTTTIIVILIILFIGGVYYYKTKPIKNSHNLPQSVELIAFNNPEKKPEYEKYIKNYKLSLSRELGDNGFNLFLTLNTNGEDLKDLKKIIISWSEWTQRIFNFEYLTTDPNVEIKNDILRIDIGSFNNCPGSRNFLKRTTLSNILTIDLLNYLPDRNDFEWKKNDEGQSKYFPMLSKPELLKFKKGLHYLDS